MGNFMDRSYSRGKSFSFGKIGDKMVGEIVDIDENATTLPDDHNNTFEATVLTVKIDAAASVSHDKEKDPIELVEDQELTLWLPTNRRALCAAVKQAILDAGANGLSVGARIAVQYTANGEQKDVKKSAPKLFTAAYKPAVKTVSADSLL